MSDDRLHCFGMDTVCPVNRHGDQVTLGIIFLRIVEMATARMCLDEIILSKKSHHHCRGPIIQTSGHILC